jgi:hypothetical protein
VVVGVTNEPKSLIEKFASEKGIKYALALDGAAMAAYGIRGIPDSVLVNPDGKVAWTGHPSSLKDSVLEAAVATATFIPPLPASQTKLNALLRAKKFGKAYTEIQAAVKGGKVEESEAAPTISAIESRMKGLLEDAEKARGEADYFTAGAMLNELKAAFAGTGESKKAAEILKEIEKDAKAREQVKAADTVEKLERALDARAFIDAYKGFKALAKKFPGTKIESLAKDRIEAMEKDRLLQYRASCPACKKEGKTCKQHRG